VCWGMRRPSGTDDRSPFVVQGVLIDYDVLVSEPVQPSAAPPEPAKRAAVVEPEVDDGKPKVSPPQNCTRR
jgi:hypothetical protein